MLSKYPSPRVLAAVGGLLALLIGAVAWRSREHPPAVRPSMFQATSHPVATGEAPARLPSSGVLSVGPEATPAGTPAPVEPAAAAIQEVFPGIAHAVRDWRTFQPETLTVAPYPDLPVTFVRTAVRTEGRYVTWIGRIPNLPGASLVGVATANGYDAIMVLPGTNQFSIHVRGDTVIKNEASPGEEICGLAPLLEQPAPVSLPTGISTGMVAGVSYVPGYIPVPDAAVEAPNKVDVLFAYDADTLKAAAASSPDPTGYIDGQLKAIVETSNLVLNQSGVAAFSWRYLGAVAAPAYTRTGKLADDLFALLPNGAIGAWVKTTRYQRGADQVMLIVGSSDDWAGIARSSRQVAIGADFSASVVKWGSTYKTIAHELAHNFGCQHDRANYQVDTVNATPVPAPDSDGYFCYGQLWENPPLPPGYTGGRGTTGTIMSYSDWTIPYFSNPNITVHVTGSLIGWSFDLEQGMQQTGRAETDPKAAYNARVLNEQSVAMSRLQEEITAPAIIDQPKNFSGIRGNSLSVSVGATGGGLSYQWMKNGAVLAGATAATYNKTAEDADAGTYTVTVSNLVGTLTSTGATVSVSAPPPPPPPASSGGGGGGGGIPSVWFLMAMGAGVLLRWFSGRRN